MTQKSTWTDAEDYWSESKSNAFNFDFDDQSKDEPTLFNSSIETTVPQIKESELKLSESLAQKQIQNLLKSEDKIESNKSISKKLSPKEGINYLVNGSDINLSLFKGKEEKLELVDRAIDSHNANAITLAVLHLKRTIKASIFNYELSRRSIAADHYIFYLKENQRIDELIDTLSMLGRHEEAAITAYNQAISCSNVETKINNLKNCLRNHFSMGGNDIIFWRDFIFEEITLLEQQLPIESDDRRQQKNSLNSMFETIGRKPITNCSVISTLHYCCLYHYSLAENHFASPKAICKTYQLSQKQIIWTSLSALAKCQHWTQIDALFEYKPLFGTKKMKAFIPFEKVLTVLQKNGAPQEMLHKYLLLIDDIDLRFDSAKEVKMTRVVIDALREGRDRKKLEELSSKVNSKSEEYSYIQNILHSFY